MPKDDLPRTGAGVTTEAQLHAAFQAQQAAFEADPVPSLWARRDALDRLRGMLLRHTDRFIAAISDDFGQRAELETRMAELNPTLFAIRHARQHLGRWMRPRRVSTDIFFWPGRSRIHPQPVGVVGVISPWNYPLFLTLSPLIAALSAGNRAILKPSEFSPAFSALLHEAIADTFSAQEVTVALGGADVARALTELPLDHLLFTGSTAVGRLVAQAAAKNLVPVTLELGGKSPAIIDESADMDRALRRLVRGKLFNAGQTCIAPDYALVPRAMVDDLAARMVALGSAMAERPGDVTAIISDRHRDRLAALIEGARAVGATVQTAAPEGGAAPAPGTVPLTVVTGAPDNTPLMQEEIFGPVLPVVGYDTVDDALRYVRARPRPLALYWFGSHTGREATVANSALAGGITINDTLLHSVQDNLPFGGVGESGMGAYHGYHGFETMSHMKAVFHQTRGFAGTDFLEPPLGTLARRVMRVADWWARR